VARSGLRSPEDTALAGAVAALARPGGLVLYPTETVYGIGGRASDGASALRLAALKGRSPGALLVLVLEVTLPWEPARRLAEAFWPGPLSIVIPAFGDVHPAVLGPDGTVGVRVPAHPLARRLVAAVGPVTSSSANRTGEPPVRDPARCVLAVDAVLDGGVLPPSPGSTLVRGDTGEVLREGAVPSVAVARVLGRLR
jgi:L-threonylcarbamoyladenylate synthase